MPSLSALRSRVAALPGTARLTEALAVPSAEVVAAAPPGARPLVVAALAPTRTGAPVLAVTATGREAEDLAAALRGLLRAGRRRRVPGLGDAAARAAQPAQRHRRPPARRAAPARPPRRRRRRRHGPLSGRRRAGARRAPADGRRASATWSRSRCRPATRSPLERRRRARSRPPPTPASTWSSSAASSRSAAASSTSSRRPRSTRCGRVLGRRGRGDPLLQGRRPALPRGRRARPVGAALPRAAAHRRRCASGPRRWPTQLPGAGRPARASSPRASPSRAWSRSRRSWSTAWSCCSTCCPPAPRVVCCDPERVRTRAHDLVATSQEFLEASLGQRRRRATPTPDRPRRCRHRVVPQPGRRPRAGRASSACRGGRLSPFAGRRRGADDDGDRRSSQAARRRRLPRRHRAARSADTAGLARPTAGASSCVTEGHGLGPARRRGARRARTSRPGSTPTLTPTPDPASCTSPRGCARRTASSRPALRLAVLTETDLTGATVGHVHQGHAPDAVPAPQPGRPAAAAARRLRRARAARRRPLRRDGAAHRAAARPASTSSSSTPRASAASPATGSSCRPTSSTRSPVRRRRGARRCTSWAAPTGRRPRAAPARRSSRSPPS